MSEKPLDALAVSMMNDGTLELDPKALDAYFAARKPGDGVSPPRVVGKIPTGYDAKLSEP